MTDPDPAVGGGQIDWTGDGPPPDAAWPPTAAGAEPSAGSSGESDAPVVEDTDEVILDDIAGLEATVESERDEYLERLQRLQAEFENYRKRMTREQSEAADRGAQRLALELLPVLDGCEAALQQGHEDVGPVHSQLMELLVKAGLERNGEPGDPFDPERHEAVMHEPAEEGGAGGSTIAEILRTGYSWNGRVLRPTMVKVRG